MNEEKLTIRKLTERECLRLQAYNDEEIDRLVSEMDEKGKRRYPKTFCYQVAGNSVCVDCFKLITEQIVNDFDRVDEPIPARRRQSTLEGWL